MVRNVLVGKNCKKLVRKVRKIFNTDAEKKKYLASWLSVGKSGNLEHGSSGKSWGSDSNSNFGFEIWRERVIKTAH